MTSKVWVCEIGSLREVDVDSQIVCVYANEASARAWLQGQANDVDYRRPVVWNLNGRGFEARHERWAIHEYEVTE